MKQFVIKDTEANQTLEKFVKKVLPDAPLSFIYKLFRKKDVKVNGHWQDNKYIIAEDDIVNVYITDQQLDEFKAKKKETAASNIASWIVYEDKNLLIINKPRGVLVQKDSSGAEALDGMVISYLTNKKEYDPNVDIGFTPAPVHRLDRNTAGLIIFGKNLNAIHVLTDAIKDKNRIQKKYLTLVKGKTDKSGDISFPLKKLTNGMVIHDKNDGKEALTHYETKEYLNNYSLVEVTLFTGRTHQIRVHFSLIDHPVIGDAKYGDYSLNKVIESKYNFKNQFLVSYILKFLNFTKEFSYLNGKEFEIKLPMECSELINTLKGEKN